MAFAIPRIQYKNVDTTGDITTGNGIISTIPDTTDIEVGMFVRGTGIPDGSLVASKTGTSVTLNAPNLATATTTGVSLSFGYEILFQFPPMEKNGEILETKANTSESLSGIRQVSVNYIEENRSLVFSFLSPAIYALLDTFLRSHALFGESFRYYEDQTLNTYKDYELDKFKVTPRKLAPRGVDTYVWEVPLAFRRVL